MPGTRCWQNTFIAHLCPYPDLSTLPVGQKKSVFKPFLPSSLRAVPFNMLWGSGYSPRETPPTKNVVYNDVYKFGKTAPTPS